MIKGWNKPRRALLRGLLLTLLAAVLDGGAAYGELQIGDICRVKGQERNTLQGIGLVMGLKGTGDNSAVATAQSLTRIMQLMGIPLPSDKDGNPLPDAVKDTKSVALVHVMAEIPSHGARQGDEIDCMISAIGSAKTLEGGTLFLTPMYGPRPAQRPELNHVFAFARGKVHLIDKENPTTARISLGCRLEESVANPFVKNGKITLVLDENHASFAVAQDIRDTINRAPDFRGEGASDANPVARALDQMSVEVRVLESYKDDPVEFAAMVLEQRLRAIPIESRVVVNESTGVIAIDADIEIAATAVTHKNMVIDIGNGQTASQFVELDPDANTAVPKLKALVDSLNALRVPSKDMIQIIRELDRRGAIYGHVIDRQ